MNEEALIKIVRYVNSYEAKNFSDNLCISIINNYLSVLYKDFNNETVIKKLILFLNEIQYEEKIE